MATPTSASKNVRKFISTIKAGGFGFIKGTGGTVTQITSRTTGVTLNKLCGTITTDTTAITAETGAEFTVTNSKVGVNDVIILSMKSASTTSATDVAVSAVAEGSFKIRVINGLVAGGTTETAALQINFAVIKNYSA